MPDDDIYAAVYDALGQIDRENPDRKPLAKTPQTALYGSASALDSLGLINLVVAVEQNVEKRFGAAITLADDRALSQEPSPFSTVETLVKYVATLIREEKNA
jgi:acyl carrier protein